MFKMPRLGLLHSFVVLAIILFASSAIPAAQTITPSDRVTSRVLVRDAPRGAPSRVVGSLGRGETAQLIESVPYYFHVRLGNGTEGYVSKASTRTSAPQANVLAASGGNLEIHFIDVGQGDASLIVCPNGSTILIDAGSTKDGSPDDVRRYLADVLEPHGFDIDYLIVTHPDADHYNLLEEALYEVPIGLAYYVGTRGQYKGSPTIYDWIRTTPIRAVQLRPTDFDKQETPNRALDCGDAHVWILSAAVEASDSPTNAMSIVVMIRYGDFEAIMTGDATHDTEDVIMGRYDSAWLQADLLKIAHHGSLATSTSEAWAASVRPKIAIASAASENSYGHPRKEVMDRLTPHTFTTEPHPVRTAVPCRGRTCDSKYRYTTNETETEAIYTTSTNGNIKVVSMGAGYQVFLNQGE